MTSPEYVEHGRCKGTHVPFILSVVSMTGGKGGAVFWSLQVQEQPEDVGGCAVSFVEEAYCLDYLQRLKFSAFVSALPQLFWLPKYI